MNREVNYVLQGFLLTLVVIGAFQFSDLLLSIPPPPEHPNDSVEGWCGTTSTNSSNAYIYKGSGPDGKAIFQNNCASCHSVFKDLTGPALGNVSDRLRDRKLLYKWVRNPAAVLKSGNIYFNSLKKQFDNVQMTAFSDLSDAEIDAIIDYVDMTDPAPPNAKALR
jgi:cytochrome c2